MAVGWRNHLGLRDHPLIRWILLEHTAEQQAALRHESMGVNGTRTTLTRGVALFLFAMCMLGIVVSSMDSSTAGSLAKVVLGMFCLLIFLVIDGSPESLGIALFMGFEAMAMAIPSGWVPVSDLGWFAAQHQGALSHFCYQMGDLLKIYYFFMLARVGKPDVRPWLFWTVVLSVPYGFLREYGADVGWDWMNEISRWRDTIAGGSGLIVCLRAWLIVRAHKMPWRKASLLTGAFAAFIEVSKSWIVHSSVYENSEWLKMTYSVFEADLAYIYAFSVFFNISTLENRVSSLSKAQAKARIIEHEMQIGQIVQKSLLGNPVIPPGVALSCHHEAAVYVSGDTYYAHWDKTDDVFTFLLNDVTGHGVQAALKASACNVLAKTIWDSETRARPESVGDGQRLIEFDRLTRKMLLEMNDEGDFNAFIGAEFSMRDGRVMMYRSNFSLPILIQPVDTAASGSRSTRWVPTAIPLQNRVVSSVDIKRGSFIVFMSDGIMDSTRHLKAFFRYLRENLPSGDISAAHVNEAIMAFHSRLRLRNHDDRTLIVFRWLP